VKEDRKNSSRQFQQQIQFTYACVEGTILTIALRSW